MAHLLRWPLASRKEENSPIDWKLVHFSGHFLRSAKAKRPERGSCWRPKNLICGWLQRKMSGRARPLRVSCVFWGVAVDFSLGEKKKWRPFFFMKKSRGGILSEEVNNLCNFFLCLIAGDCLFTTGVRCQNGVCLDHQCYCNDGYGGKGCSMPGNSFESRPTFYFWRKMRLTFFFE